VTILNIDAMRFMSTLPDESVDLIVTDPPYRTISGGSGPDPVHQRPTGMLAANDGKLFKHNDLDVSEWAPEVFRVLRSPGQMWVFTNELNRRRFEDAFLAAGFKIHGLHGWLKQNCTPNKWGMKNWEPVLLLRKGPARALYTPGLKQMIAADNPVGSKLHPTEKPVALLTRYVEASSAAGQLVFDPFAGAGSTGLAAASTGRRFLGCEIDPKYYEIARERLDGTD
jgi:site-specific DNA-methyltransferase (adenine-specific)